MSEYVYGFEPIDYGMVVIPPDYTMVKREEVVRCKYCEYYRESKWIIATDVPSVCMFFANGVQVEPDGFCKWGKRKEV